MDVSHWLPADAIKIILVLSLSFLIGLEREEHAVGGGYSFGGVRTFPLIGLIGYSAALLAHGALAPISVGFAVIAGFLIISYRYKLSESPHAGITTEMSGLVTYLIGALVYNDQYWIATTVSVAGILLLELKTALESLTKTIAPLEILTFAKFLLLSAVILPILPNQAIGPFEINPFRTWLVVVAVSAISYGSYVIGRLTRGQGGIVLAAILGGVYSSTLTTVVLAQRAAQENRPHLFAGCTLMASGVMYVRLAVLLGIFNRDLLLRLGPSFGVLAVLALIAGWLWSRLPDADAHPIAPHYQPKNPLELRAAFLFAALFVAILIATHYTLLYLGQTGLYGLAAIMGVTDVDPFIMSVTQSAGGATPVVTATAAILIAAASNNLVKGLYAAFISGRRTGIQSAALLAGLTIAGLIPLLWI